MLTVQSTTPPPKKPRRAGSVYRYEALDTSEAKRRMNLPFVPETAYRVMLGELDLGIVVYHRVMKDWFAEGCLSNGLRHAFAKRERAALGLKLRAQREGRI